jgi:hypothetical protein
MQAIEHGRMARVDWRRRTLIAVTMAIQSGCLAQPSELPTMVSSPTVTPGVAIADDKPPYVASASPLPGKVELVERRLAGGDLVIGVPKGWSRSPRLHSDVWRFHSPDGGSELAISYGASAYETERLTVCGPEPCILTVFRPTYPFRTTEPLMDSMRERIDRILSAQGAVVRSRRSSVDRRWEVIEASTSASNIVFAYAANGPRPLVLYGSSPAAIDQASLKMLLDRVEYSPEPEPVLEFAAVRDAGLGFEVQVPKPWLASGAAHMSPPPGVRQWHGAALTISIGNRDGSIWLCDESDCHREVLKSLDEIERAVDPRQSSSILGLVQVQDITLGGDPGRREGYSFGSTHYLVRVPGIYEYAYAVHHGRPVVISIDWWLIHEHRLAPESVDQILDSFRFVD